MKSVHFNINQSDRMLSLRESFSAEAAWGGAWADFIKTCEAVGALASSPGGARAPRSALPCSPLSQGSRMLL